MCVESKHPHNGNMANAQLEAAYHGAMVNAAWGQHKFMRQTPEAFLHATWALTATYNGRTLRIFAHSTTAHEDARIVMESGVEYPDTLVFHQHLLKDVCTISQLGFQKTCNIFRNAQDWGSGSGHRD
jgi:hypothetical protein